MRRVNDRVDIRSNDLATLVTLSLASGGTISQKKRKRYAGRVPEASFEVIEAAVRDVLDDADDADDE